MASSSRFTLGGFTINYCKFYQMLEVITEKDGMEGGCRWFLPKREKKSIRDEKIVDSGGNEH